MHRRRFLRHAALLGAAATCTPRRLLAGPRGLRDPWVGYLDDPAFGGRADGTTLNDGAFLQALEDMPPEGGMLVLRPGGEWRFASVDLSLVGRRNVTLWAEGARIRKHAYPVGHLFHDALGVCDGFRVIGGDFDAGRQHFQPGDVSSPFFFSRTDDLTFVGATFRNGIEEGLKLYKPVGVRIHRCRFEGLRNNGVQVAASPFDVYRGAKPNRGPLSIHVTDSEFVGIDDDLDGLEGQGFSVGSDDPGHPAVDVTVRRCVLDGCVRGLWSENNQGGTPAREVWFEDNEVRRSEFHGLGLVGVKGGGLRRNRLVDIGTTVPDPAYTLGSETAGLILSGSDHLYSEDLLVEGNEIVDRRGTQALMQWGIIVRQQRRLTLRDNVVAGARVAPLRVGSIEDCHIEAPRSS